MLKLEIEKLEKRGQEQELTDSAIEDTLQSMHCQHGTILKPEDFWPESQEGAAGTTAAASTASGTKSGSDPKTSGFDPQTNAKMLASDLKTSGFDPQTNAEVFAKTCHNNMGLQRSQSVPVDYGSRSDRSLCSPAADIGRILGDGREMLNFSDCYVYMKPNGKNKYYYALWVDDLNNIVTNKNMFATRLEGSAHISLHLSWLPTPEKAQRFKDLLVEHLENLKSKKNVAHFMGKARINYEASKPDYALLDIIPRELALHRSCLTMVTGALQKVGIQPALRNWKRLAFHVSIMTEKQMPEDYIEWESNFVQLMDGEV